MISRQKPYLKKLEKAFPAEVAEQEENIAEQIADARDEFKAARVRSPGLNALEKTVEKISTDTTHLSKLDKIADDLPTLKADTVGAGLRRNIANASAYANATIKASGVFNIKSIAMSGGDLGGLWYGQTEYGVNPFSAITDNLLAAVRELAGIPSEIRTVVSIANMAFGRVAENPILYAALEKLDKHGIKPRGDVFFNAARNMQAQLDAILDLPGGSVVPLDAKALTSFEKKN